MDREAVAVKSVKDIQPNEKRWLEGVLGQTIREDQQILIMVITPGEMPTESARREALSGLERTWDRVQEHMREQGIGAAEFDAAVDEAMEHVRRREP
jgi:hypothetical protein